MALSPQEIEKHIATLNKEFEKEKVEFVKEQDAESKRILELQESRKKHLADLREQKARESAELDVYIKERNASLNYGLKQPVRDYKGVVYGVFMGPKPNIIVLSSLVKGVEKGSRWDIQGLTRFIDDALLGA